MKLLISTALISTAMIATSAMAQQPLQASTPLNTVELNTIFDASQLENLQATELSNQEMKDTQGAWVNFAVGAGIGFGGYALSNFSTSLSSAGCLACRGFVNSYQDNWSWSNAAFSTGVGALTSGVGGAALRSTGITQNWGQMTFANRGFIANTAKNMERTWTNPVGIGIKVTGTGSGFAANQTYDRLK
jgi:hypothetical protein